MSKQEQTDALIEALIKPLEDVVKMQQEEIAALKGLVLSVRAASIQTAQSRVASLASMKAVSDYVKPNWSNDLPWEDEIIIAIDHMVHAGVQPQAPLTDDECDAFRRAPVPFRDMVRLIWEHGRNGFRHA